jgi:hypothetical protein
LTLTTTPFVKFTCRALNAHFRVRSRIIAAFSR